MLFRSASDHSEAGDANLEVRMMGIETEVRDAKTELKNFNTDMKNINSEIFHKIDLLGIKFESSQKEMTHTFEKKLDSYALDHKEQVASYAHSHQKQFFNFYLRCLFGVRMYRFLTQLRSWVSWRCWSVAHASCQ